MDIFFRAPKVSFNLHHFTLKFLHSFAFIMAMLFANMALTYISYPTQALAKSCKILPVMFGGWFVKHIHYHPLQYLGVALITGGILMFNLLKVSSEEAVDSAIGLFLLLGSLMMDAMNGYVTETVRHEVRPSSLSMMKYCNLWGAAITGVLVAGRCGLEEEGLLEFFEKYPETLVDCVLFGAMSALGQLFIFRGIKVLGALTLNIITTTRKFMTVTLSIILFNHLVSFQQWLCLLMVFAGTFLDFYVNFFLKKKKQVLDSEKHSK